MDKLFPGELFDAGGNITGRFMIEFISIRAAGKVHN